MTPGTKFIASHNMFSTKFVLVEIDKKDFLFPFVLKAYEIERGGVWQSCDFTEKVASKWFFKRRIHFV